MKHFYFLFLLLVACGSADPGTDTFAKMEADITNGVYPNIHGLLISRNDSLLYEHYWPGKDQMLGQDLGVIAHGKDSLHDTRSVTKSFVGACIGIAIGQGLIKSVDTPIWSFFPEYARLDTGMKKTLTLRHLLTMSSGLDWNEILPSTDPKNTDVGMDRSSDPIKYVLSLPIIHPAGTVWNYSGGTTEVLGAIIRKVSGKSVDSFARQYLFEPLGIDHWQWIRDPQWGTPSAAAGLRLSPGDLLKFGLLYANGGVWKGRSVLPAGWVDSSLATHIQRESSDRPGGYGYLFWTFTTQLKDGLLSMPACLGNGDQWVIIDRKHRVVVVVTAGNYVTAGNQNRRTEQKTAFNLLNDDVYPGLGLK